MISTVHCAGSDTSGCAPVATVPVGAAPRAVGIVDPTDSVFVGNRNDLTVSVFDGSTCNGNEHVGLSPGSATGICWSAPFPTLLVTTGTILSAARWCSIRANTRSTCPCRAIPICQVDTNQCRAGHVDNCHVKIMKQRAGGLLVTAALDDATGTVYVVNDHDGSVSVFPQ